MSPDAKSWLPQKVRQIRASMEKLVRRLIREERASTKVRPKPSEVFARHFGEEHGVDLPPPAPRGYRPISFPDGMSE